MSLNPSSTPLHLHLVARDTASSARETPESYYYVKGLVTQEWACYHLCCCVMVHWVNLLDSLCPALPVSANSSSAVVHSPPLEPSRSRHEYNVWSQLANYEVRVALPIEYIAAALNHSCKAGNWLVSSCSSRISQNNNWAEEDDTHMRGFGAREQVDLAVTELNGCYK